MINSRKFFYRLKCIALLSSSLWISCSIAGDLPSYETDLGVTSFSGFGTIGGVYHNTKDTVFRRDFSQPKGGKSGDVYFGSDSSLGVQVNHKFNENIDSALQVVSRLNHKGNFTPQVTWAYLKFAPFTGTSIRAGRLGIEVYLQGDAAEIDYANIPVRQPVIFIPRTYNGIDAEYSSVIGDNSIFRAKVMMGRTVGITFPVGEEYNMNNFPYLGGILEYSHGAWLFRSSLNYLKSSETSAAGVFKSAFNSLSNVPGVSINNADEIIKLASYENKKWLTSLLSVSYDDGPLQWQGTYSNVKPSSQPARNIIFTNLSYRINSFTPYIGYTLMKTKRKFTELNYTNLYQIPQIEQTLQILNKGVLSNQSGYMTNQSIFTTGIRYDLSTNAALKLQADVIRYKDAEAVLDTRLSDYSNTKYTALNKGWRTMPVISAALNFVF